MCFTHIGNIYWAKDGNEQGLSSFALVQHGNFAKGYNNIVVGQQLSSKTGVLYYKVETASATRKMVQIR